MQAEYGEIVVKVPTSAFFTTDPEFLTLHGLRTYDFVKQLKKILKQRELTSQESNNIGKYFDISLILQS